MEGGTGVALANLAAAMKVPVDCGHDSQLEQKNANN